jgi:hypothetical protein
MEVCTAKCFLLFWEAKCQDLHELKGVSLAKYMSAFNSASAFFGNGAFVRGVSKLLGCPGFRPGRGCTRVQDIHTTDLVS